MPMRTILILTCASLLFPASANAWVKRLKIPGGETVEWTTPQRFDWTDDTVFKPKVNGRVLKGDEGSYTTEGKRRCHLGWARPAILIDASMRCRRRDNVTLRITNPRERRSARVRISYWIPGIPDEAK